MNTHTSKSSFHARQSYSPPSLHSSEKSNKDKTNNISSSNINDRSSTTDWYSLFQKFKHTLHSSNKFYTHSSRFEKPHYHRPFINTHNTCFNNSVLQALTASSYFYYLLLLLKDVNINNIDTHIISYKYIKEFIEYSQLYIDGYVHQQKVNEQLPTIVATHAEPSGAQHEQSVNDETRSITSSIPSSDPNNTSTTIELNDTSSANVPEDGTNIPHNVLTSGALHGSDPQPIIDTVSQIDHQSSQSENKSQTSSQTQSSARSLSKSQRKKLRQQKAIALKQQQIPLSNTNISKLSTKPQISSIERIKAENAVRRKQKQLQNNDTQAQSSSIDTNQNHNVLSPKSSILSRSSPSHSVQSQSDAHSDTLSQSQPSDHQHFTQPIIHTTDNNSDYDASSVNNASSPSQSSRHIETSSLCSESLTKLSTMSIRGSSLASNSDIVSNTDSDIINGRYDDENSNSNSNGDKYSVTSQVSSATATPTPTPSQTTSYQQNSDDIDIDANSSVASNDGFQPIANKKSRSAARRQRSKLLQQQQQQSSSSSSSHRHSDTNGDSLLLPPRPRPSSTSSNRAMSPLSTVVNVSSSPNSRVASPSPSVNSEYSNISQSHSPSTSSDMKSKQATPSAWASHQHAKNNSNVSSHTHISYRNYHPIIPPFNTMMSEFWSLHKCAAHSQMDCHEWMHYILDVLHTCMRKLDNHSKERHNSIGYTNSNDDMNDSNRNDDEWHEVGKKNKTYTISSSLSFSDSPVSLLFNGRLRSSLNVRASTSSINTQPFYSISLDIASPHIHNINTAVDTFMSRQIIEGYKSQKQSHITTATQRHTLESLPLILCFHLKRFDVVAMDHINSDHYFASKLNKYIHFDRIFQFQSKYISGFQGNKQNTVYDLIAIIVHHGDQMSSGHYTTFVRDIDYSNHNNQHNEQQWWHCDDEYITRVSTSTVYEQTPYMLFYQKSTF